ncbi:MAG: DUF3298 domain-containing protein, partial [Cyclobacteriaceae bacterium]
LTIVFGLIIISGCEVDRAPTETPSIVSYPPYTLETKSVSRQTGNCDVDTARHCTQVEMLYQLVSDTVRTDAVERINESILSSIAGVIGYDSTKAVPSPETQADQFVADYEDMVREFPEAFGWEMNLSGEVLRNDSAFLVIRIRVESYTGGAHGSQNLQFLNFNPVTGTKIELQDLFIPGFEETLNRLSLDAFRDVRNLAADVDPVTEGYNFYQDRYYNPDNFAVLDNVLVFYFNHYEIAPYSAGPTTIEIPLEELGEILVEI